MSSMASATSTTIAATTTESTSAAQGGGATTTVTQTATGTATSASVPTSTSSTTSTTNGNGLNGQFSSLERGPLAAVQSASLYLAPMSWTLVAGAWFWRGRVRTKWRERGFDSDVFELFMKMKGGATRIKLLNSLGSPKDRLQLAHEMKLDWKAIDRHVQILSKYGFVSEQAAYGSVRLYQVTPMGKMVLDLFNELEQAEKSQERKAGAGA